MNISTSKSAATGAIFKLALILAFSIAAGVVTYVVLQPRRGPIFKNSDFEQGNLSRWRAEGRAFANQPTFEDNPLSRGIKGATGFQGKYWVGTFENRPQPSSKKGGVQEDAPIGKLISQTFTVRRNTLTFLIGAGKGGRETSVALVVGGRTVLSESANAQTAGFTEKMRKVTWDVSPWRGQKANLVLYDMSSSAWGHLNADDFRYA